jgi:hypothetical protein
VAAVGRDRVLISAPGTDTSSTGAGYLFSTNGVLITNFKNPDLTATFGFGYSAAAMGNNRVLIGDSVAVHLFSTNGTLLTTFTLAPDNYFGAVTAVGSDRVFMGSDAGGPEAAFLFAIPYPPLNIARNAATVSLSWVTPEPGLALQQTDLLSTTSVWNDTTNSVSINGQTNVVQQSIASGTTNRFFRLHRP